VFDRLSKLDHNTAMALGAQLGPYDKVPSLRLSDQAHDNFLHWREDLERLVRSGELSAALEGHVAKYRKLVPALALMNHLADGGDGPVAPGAMLKALAYSRYLESHARRVYGATSEIEVGAGKAILAKIRAGVLKDGFTVRDIHRAQWSGLTDGKNIRAGLDLLIDLDHIQPSGPTTHEHGGRPKIFYFINPRSVR
jgi:putative DNA primase/helicase